MSQKCSKKLRFYKNEKLGPPETCTYLAHHEDHEGHEDVFI